MSEKLSPVAKKALIFGGGAIGGFEALTHLTTTFELGAVAVLGYGALQVFGTDKQKTNFKSFTERTKAKLFK